MSVSRRFIHKSNALLPIWKHTSKGGMKALLPFATAHTRHRRLVWTKSLLPKMGKKQRQVSPLDGSSSCGVVVCGWVLPSLGECDWYQVTDWAFRRPAISSSGKLSTTMRLIFLRRKQEADKARWTKTILATAINTASRGWLKWKFVTTNNAKRDLSFRKHRRNNITVKNWILSAAEQQQNAKAEIARLKQQWYYHYLLYPPCFTRFWSGLAAGHVSQDLSHSI